MKTRPGSKKYLAALSTSAIAAGMAQGAVVYNYYNHTVIAGGNNTFSLDLNRDGSSDFLIAFSNNNHNKPYIDNSAGLTGPMLPYVLADSALQGLPVTAAGTTIDGSYLSPQTKGYFHFTSTDNQTAGEWDSQGADIDGYVGLSLTDSDGNPHFGWAHFIYNNATVVNGVVGTLTLVDAGWETRPNVAIAAGQTAEPGEGPVLVISPSSQTNYVGTTTHLMAIATGNPSPAYQWKAGAPGSGVYTNLIDSSTVLGSTNTTLILSNVLASADYVVTVTNANGATNSPLARLTLSPLLITGLTPSPAQAYTGSKLIISAGYLSSVPVSFQWRKGTSDLKDGGNISGATTSTLVISRVSATDVGGYSVVATNIYGAVTSAIDPLVVIAPASSYEAAVASLGPLSYYRLNETSDPAAGSVIAFDLVGGLNGTYGTEVQNGNSKYNIAGPRPDDGFLGFDVANAAMVVGPTAHNPTSFVSLPAPHFNTNTVTFTAWINPATIENNWNVILSYRSAVAGSACGLNFQGSSTGLGYHWNDTGTTYNWNSMLYPPTTQWSFVAIAVSATDAVIYLFNANGTATATNTVDHAVAAFDSPGYLGGDNNDPSFVGSIDEVAIFNRTLTLDELTTLYNAAVTDTRPVVLNIQQANGNLTLTWAHGTLLEASSLQGPWSTNNAASPYKTAPAGSGKFYRVQVQ